jgi:hypothetical protein
MGAATVACAGSHETDANESVDVTEAQLPQRDLALGAQGTDVKALHAYLRRFGYFPSAELQQRFPEWRPLVNRDPADEGTYDTVSAEAVSLFQANAGLVVTSTVDEPTRAALHMSTCGVPEGARKVDESEKFSYNGCKFSHSTITWRLTNTQNDVSSNSDVGLTDGALAIGNGLRTWANAVGLSLDQMPHDSTDPVDIEFTWVASLGGAHAQTSGCQHRLIEIDAGNRWSTASPTPGERLDFESVMAHEAGHAFGLHHSRDTSSLSPPDVPGAVMWRSISAAEQRRHLRPDDQVAIRAAYDPIEQLVGGLLDVGAGTGGQVWAIGQGTASGSHKIHFWTGSSWATVSGGAERIAVAPDGVPWIVNSDGQILKRTTNSPSSGSWVTVGGCANDIGIGAAGDIWITNCTAASGGFRVSKWNGTSWVQTSDSGAGTRIAVAANGVPWLVNNLGRVFRRSSASTSPSTWEQMPITSFTTSNVQADDVSATDIAVGDTSALSPTSVPHVWVIGNNLGGGYAVNLWNEQEALGTPNTGSYVPPAFNWVQVWRRSANTGAAVSATLDGPWFVNGSGAVYRQSVF